MPLPRKGTREFVAPQQWQIEEIKKAIDEADRDEFASDQEVEQTLLCRMRWSPTGDC
jgi:predicted transcriptional regulator